MGVRHSDRDLFNYELRAVRRRASVRMVVLRALVCQHKPGTAISQRSPGRTRAWD